MDLRTRLRRINYDRGPVVEEPPVVARTGGPPLDALLEGSWRESSGGRCFVTEQRFPADHGHGQVVLGDLLGIASEAWLPFLHGVDGSPLDLSRAAFVDIETTGLSRGAGTHAFLVGIGGFDAEGFRVRQYFMPGYEDEEALLDGVAEDLAGRSGLVSFNGRTFDWPILETRYVLSRREPPKGMVPHLDMLPLSRRLWRRRFGSCALASLERSVLGLQRDGSDVPGYLVPQLYEEYVRFGVSTPMVGVFYHNVTDILSTAALAALAGQLVSRADDDQPAEVCDPLAMALLYERLGRYEEALGAYRLAAEQYAGTTQADDAKRLWSLLLKRLGQYEAAMAIWWQWLQSGDVFPYIELAKQLEHRLRDYAAAERVVLDALEWVQAHGRLLGVYQRQMLVTDLQHRLERLRARQVGRAARDGARSERT
ncbi:MAG: ribonuclease H-like domain-containing protein [Anaerolineae bacterium]